MTETQTRSVDLLVGGMTCASCVARVEKKLNRLEGVEASVNLATASARVRFDPGLVDEHTLVETVERTGYTASLPSTDEDDVATEEATYARSLLRRLLLAAPLTVVVLVLAMAPGVPRLPWVQLVLTLPVVLYAGWPFHRAAAINARRLASTMDTLVSLGTLVALAWSVFQLLEGGMHLYFEVAATVTTFLLLGRYLEARAKSRAGFRTARPARAGRQAGDRAGGRHRAGGRRRGPPPRDAHARPPGRAGPDGRRRGRGCQRGRRVDGHRREPPGREGRRRRGRRRHPECRRPTGRRGDPHRSRHPAGPHPSVGRGRPDGQGPDPATGRPDLRRVRPGGAGHRNPHLRRLAAHR